ncbi:MAG: hydroxyacid dehydrogenase [Candidatus Hodarchaeales archaeon]|jgi:D-3-phosphoglycerate dehydrogenase
MKILVTDSIANEAHELLKQFHEVFFDEVDADKLIEIIPDYEAILVRSRTKITSEVINAGKKLKVIGRVGIGVDNIDITTATKRKIPVVYAPNGSTISVAEITVGQMIALARKIVASDKSMKEGKWEKNKLKGIELAKKTLGLIGFGRIGNEVAIRCQAFGMNIVAYDPYISAEIAQKKGIELISNVNELLIHSDFISIHALLTDETRGMIGVEAFEIMKPTAFIINHSRGGIINEEALIEALKKNKIAGAALDVFSIEPLHSDSQIRKEIPNLHLTPHIAASTKEAQIKAGLTTVKGVIDVLKGNKPKFCINLSIYD